jgi:ketosteroid isomerase-like protein
MSSANLDLVRSIYADWERGDWSRGDWADPEIEFVIADGPDPSSWAGLPAVAEGWRKFLSAWEGYRGEALEYREIDGERVCVLIQVRGRGKVSGLELGHASANVFTLRGGKVTRLVIYWQSEHALADLGLAADDG